MSELSSSFNFCDNSPLVIVWAENRGRDLRGAGMEWANGHDGSVAMSSDPDTDTDSLRPPTVTACALSSPLPALCLFPSTLLISSEHLPTTPPLPWTTLPLNHGVRNRDRPPRRRH